MAQIKSITMPNTGKVYIDIDSLIELINGDINYVYNTYGNRDDINPETIEGMIHAYQQLIIKLNNHKKKMLEK